MGTCEFFYDFSSPFSYLAATQVEAATAGHTLVWRPMLLGAVFKALGGPLVPLLEFSPAKARYALADQYRWADALGVPFRFASKFPQRTVLPLRAALSVPPAHLGAVSRALFRVMWVEDGDLEDPAQVARAIASVGLDGAAAVAAAESGPARDVLRANTDDAVRRGVFGAPTFLVGEQLFWGQDRLPFVRKALEGWSPRFPDDRPLPPGAGSA